MKALTNASAALAIFCAAALLVVRVIVSGATVGPITITGIATEMEDYRIIAERGREATAVVTGVTTPRRTKITDKIRHSVSARFTAGANGIDTEYWIDDDDMRALFAGPAVGRTLAVRYDPEDPRRSAPAFTFTARAASMAENAGLFALIRRGFAIACAVFAGVFIASIAVRVIKKS